LWSGQPLASRFATARVQHAKYRFDHLLLVTIWWSPSTSERWTTGPNRVS
jgi:hypothetical protein